MSESVVLCEGFHDRAFWAGWFLHLGCIDPGLPTAGKTTRSPIDDPWKTRVSRGHFAYHSNTGLFVRVVPCGGKSQVLPTARLRLNERRTKPLLRLVVNVDTDVAKTGNTAETGLRVSDMEREVRVLDSSAHRNPDGEIEVDGGTTKVSLIRWETPDSDAPGLPAQQTLERLVCASLIAAYPPRAKAVQDWLSSRPTPPALDPKEHAWSYMAGWYADYGCEAFYSNLWQDPAVVAQLESRLRASGAWQIAETLAS